jgi:hypothetical protein
MVNGKDRKIANILYIYMFLKNSQNQYKSDWLKCIKNILDRCGYSNVWISQGNVNPKWLSVSLKKKYLTNSNKNGDLILKTHQKGCVTDYLKTISNLSII